MPIPPPADRRPTLTLFCGPPGSGKTTLARQLEREGHGVRLCTDEWQQSLAVDPLDGVLHGRLVLDRAHVEWAFGVFQPPTDAELTRVDEAVRHGAD